MAQHNKKTGEDLKERLKHISTENFATSKEYSGLLQDLQDMKKYIEEIKEQKFLENNPIEEKFKYLRKKCDDSISLLKKSNTQGDSGDINLLQATRAKSMILNEVNELFKTAQRNE